MQKTYLCGLGSTSTSVLKPYPIRQCIRHGTSCCVITAFCVLFKICRMSKCHDVTKHLCQCLYVGAKEDVTDFQRAEIIRTYDYSNFLVTQIHMFSPLVPHQNTFLALYPNYKITFKTIYLIVV